ncbi:CD99 antigen-like isoform X2 [Microtus oregoni]|uniref:CD99 antigen-like isoform X2 n=1 Tax=Microtus oregoni TaxID=111838 RepID=UPI001BB11D50|nr:CD99 antigen-like isoform X2 [Microtus oregoni]
MAPALLLLFAFALLGGLGRGQDFDLSDALDEPKKPTSPPKKPPPSGGDLDLSDALGGGDDPAPPPPRPKPKPDRESRPSGGDFSNRDLEEAAGGKGGGRGPQGEEEPEADGSAPQGLVPGLIGAAVAAVAGAISSFVAYQRRRLCFREHGDDGGDFDLADALDPDPTSKPSGGLYPKLPADPLPSDPHGGGKVMGAALSPPFPQVLC